MKISSQQFKIRGMNKDLSYSAFNPEYSWENRNVRLTARDGNDLLSVTNEKGNTTLSMTEETRNALAVEITTSAASGITINSAISGGSVNSNYPLYITNRGICWSTNHNPTIADFKTSDGTTFGSFTSSLTGLNNNTTYYIRAYAKVFGMYYYGNEVSVTTLMALPAVTTVAISSIAETSAISGGVITSTGGGDILSKGVCWSTSNNPTISGSKTTDGSGSSTFSSSITGLTSNTLYYVRAYCTNSAGTSYGAQLSFYSLPVALDPPIVYTVWPSMVWNSEALSGVGISAVGGSAIATSGICWSTSPNPTILSELTTDGLLVVGEHPSSMTLLSKNTTYYVRAYATNLNGYTSYGDEITYNHGEMFNTLSTTIDYGPTSVKVYATSTSIVQSDVTSELYSNGVDTSYRPTIRSGQYISENWFEAYGLPEANYTLNAVTPTDDAFFTYTV